MGPPLQGADNSVRHLGVGLTTGAVLLAVWVSVLIVVLVLVRTLNYDHRVDATALDWCVGVLVEGVGVMLRLWTGAWGVLGEGGG